MCGLPTPLPSLPWPQNRGGSTAAWGPPAWFVAALSSATLPSPQTHPLRGPGTNLWVWHVGSHRHFKPKKFQTQFIISSPKLLLNQSPGSAPSPLHLSQGHALQPIPLDISQPCPSSLLALCLLCLHSREGMDAGAPPRRPLSLQDFLSQVSTSQCAPGIPKTLWGSWCGQNCFMIISQT